MPDNNDMPCYHLVWTRYFKEPLVFGLVSLSNFMKQSFRNTSSPIMNFVFRQYFANQLPPENKRLPRKGDRVVIVGAGPSGLHMAHLLKNEVGIEDITIYEKTQRHRGKTLTYPHATQEGIVHELGTCFLRYGPICKSLRLCQVLNCRFLRMK